MWASMALKLARIFSQICRKGLPKDELYGDKPLLESRRRAHSLTKASGGLRVGDLRPVAETGVDCLSLGELTHSAVAADIGMDVEAIR